MPKKENCPTCKKNIFSTFIPFDNYRLAKCFICGLVWDPNPPQRSKEQFGEDYFVSKDLKNGYANYIESMKINRITFIERLKKIKKRIGNTGKLLDVGCALGDCLVEAKALGWNDIYGVDPSSYSYKISKKKGLNVQKGTLRNMKLHGLTPVVSSPLASAERNPAEAENLRIHPRQRRDLLRRRIKFKPDSFDIILYQDVIEHINDPLEELKIIRRILKPGGWLFIVTPDIDGWWAKILGSHWYHYRPTDHLVYFSKKSIINALGTAGFINPEVRKTYHIMSLAYIFTRLRFYSPALFKFLLKIIQEIRLSDLPVKMYTGELEAWAQKPKNYLHTPSV